MSGLPNTEKALAEFDALDFDGRLDDIKTNEQMNKWQAEKAEAHEALGHAFYKDTKAINCLDNCLLSGRKSVGWLRERVAEWRRGEE